MNIQDCLEQRFLVEEVPDNKLIEKEIQESSFDLESAEKAFGETNYKWTIIQSYYSMFHAAKAVCFKLGYREKKHFALLIVLEELNKSGKLEREFVNQFNAAIDARENADYQYNYSREAASESIKRASTFNLKMRELLKKL